MSSSRIYVDFDDVLCETARELALLVRELFGTVRDYPSIRHFDLARSFDLSTGQYERLMRRAHDPEVLERMLPCAGSADCLAAWRTSGYAIAIMTGRPPSTRAASLAWLDRYRIPHDELHFVDKYGRFGSDRGECIALADVRREDFAFAVEDAPAMVRHLCGQLGLPVVVPERPWNRELLEDACLHGAAWAMCGDWHEIARRFGGGWVPVHEPHGSRSWGQ